MAPVVGWPFGSRPAVSNPFVRRLEHGAALADADRRALSHLVRNARTVRARHVLAVEGDRVPRMLVVLAGWACRCKTLVGGRCQITDLLLPGDACHLHTGTLARTDHAVEALTPCTVAEVDPAELLALLDRSPGASRALWWSSLQTDSMLREALVNNGRRRAEVRLAHLICEVQARLSAVGLVEESATGDRFVWPLTQTDLAEVTSMTPVHANRMMKTLRETGLIVDDRRTMRVPDAAQLAAFCGFRSDYLHLTSGSAPLAA